MDSFCDSMDSYRIVTTNRGSRILTLKDSFRIVSHESSQFSKIRMFLRIQRILKFWTRESGFANPNLKDSFRGFVSWKQKFQITRFVSIRKDSYTNPASLIFLVSPYNTSLKTAILCILPTGERSKLWKFPDNPTY